MIRKWIKKSLNFIEKYEKYCIKHPFPMKAIFRNCFLVNYSMEPQTLQNVLPPGLTPDLYKGKAFVSIVIADLEDMRIGFLPKCFGMNYKQIVYRAHVLAPNGERGVTFLKSYANSVPMSFTGSLFSIFHFNMCDVLWQGLSHLPPRSVQSVQEDLKDPNVQINNEIE